MELCQSTLFSLSYQKAKLEQILLAALSPYDIDKISKAWPPDHQIKKEYESVALLGLVCNL